MRIITQNVPGGTSAKILPKPSQLTTPSGAPVVVVSAGSSQSVTSTVAMLNRPITTFSGEIFNPYLTNGFSHRYQLAESTFIFRGVRSDFYFLS